MTEPTLPTAEWDERRRRWDRAEVEKNARVARGRPVRSASGGVVYENEVTP